MKKLKEDNKSGTKYGYQNITLHVNPAIYKQLAIAAIREETTIKQMAGEAIISYLYHLKKLDDVEAAQELKAMRDELRANRKKKSTR
jgi:single-stranded DNA-specific DHH superfamily exonuclease